MDKKYRIRLAIVRTLHRFFCPQELNAILCADEILMLEADNSQILKEWNMLREAEKLCDVAGYPGYCSLSPALRKKLDDGLTLNDDPFFYGPSALGK